MSKGLLEIRLPNNKTQFVSSEEVEVELGWSLEKMPERVELRVVWSTEGRGTTDLGIADVHVFDAVDRKDSKIISLILPEAPYSFSGQLITLQWALELVAVPSQESYRQEITISPDSGSVVLVSQE